ncbi:unnamed protein product [Allacma fusca]|uniref:Uncharacterized protein n=1 Tax=Allacma fusca TaxID=39272 RepID=A0A8J2K5D3_9HEXA|nr:unnamed protein product [Allacma fusca]
MGLGLRDTNGVNKYARIITDVCTHDYPPVIKNASRDEGKSTRGEDKSWETSSQADALSFDDMVSMRPGRELCDFDKLSVFSSTFTLSLI